MRAEDDRAARLDRDQHLVDGGRGRVGRRHDRRDDAERLGDLDDLPVLDAIDDADGLHRPDELVDLTRGEQVLLDLVGDHAVTGLVDGEAGQRFGVRRHRVGHCRDDGVDPLLREFGEQRLRLPRGPRQRSRLGDRGEILVGWWCRVRSRHI
jgi:hypothetical protein